MKLHYFILLCLLAVVSCTPQPANNSKRQRAQSVQTAKRNTQPKAPQAKTQKYTAEEIFRRCSPAVFTITTADEYYQRQGSGFFISSSGLAVSNYHVFRGTYLGAETLYMPSGEQFKIKEVIKSDEENDFILFRVDVGNQKMPYIEVTKRKPIIGSKIYAIGSPKGLTNTFSSGEISQLREDYCIQINAPIDHGSSGGALINEYAEVIGITSGGRDDSGANLNFAIDISVIKPYIPHDSH